MKYTVETTERFEKEFKRLDRYTQRMLKSWIEKNLVGCENPRAKGKGKRGDEIPPPGQVAMMVSRRTVG